MCMFMFWIRYIERRKTSYRADNCFFISLSLKYSYPFDVISINSNVDNNFLWEMLTQMNEEKNAHTQVSKKQNSC